MSDLLELQLQVLWSCLMLALDSGPLQNRYVLYTAEPSSLQPHALGFYLDQVQTLDT